MKCSAPPSSLSHVCRLVPSVFVFLCLSVCVYLFQVALTCSMPPMVPPKRISPSLTACALPPLSSLVLTLVFVSVHTESVLFPTVCNITPEPLYGILFFPFFLFCFQSLDWSISASNRCWFIILVLERIPVNSLVLGWEYVF